MATLVQSDLVVPVSAGKPRFFVNAAAACLAVGILGFAPTYWIPLLTGHGVGRAIHEPPMVANEYDPRQRDLLTEGLVLTIEPMIAAGSGRTVQDRDGWTIKTRDGSLASHHEHTLVITRDRPIVLTAAAA